MDREQWYQPPRNCGKFYPRVGYIIDYVPISHLCGCYNRSHLRQRCLERAIPWNKIEAIFAAPLLIARQWNGARFLFISAEGGVVITSTGAVVTAWGREDHDSDVWRALHDAGYRC